MKQSEDWQPDSYYSIREMDVDNQVYVMVGRGGPPSGDAVAKAKKKYAEDNDVKFRHLKGVKIGNAPRRDGGAIVAVYERPEKSSHDALP